MSSILRQEQLLETINFFEETYPQAHILYHNPPSLNAKDLEWVSLYDWKLVKTNGVHVTLSQNAAVIVGLVAVSSSNSQCIISQMISFAKYLSM